MQTNLLVDAAAPAELRNQFAAAIRAALTPHLTPKGQRTLAAELRRATSAQQVLDIAQEWITTITVAESPGALEALQDAQAARAERRPGKSSAELFAQAGY